MKTKVFLLAAAVFAVGASTTMAQVYSANAVGYVNLTLPPGFSLIANPLDNTNNGINNLFAGLPNQTRVYRFNANQTYTIATKLGAVFNNNLVMDPGEGFFIQIPGAASVNVTFVGEVMQGNLVNPLLAGAYQIKGSQVPQALPAGRPNQAPADQTLGFPAAVGDRIFLFDNVTGYQTHQFLQLGPNQLWNTAGSPNGPTIGVARGFFLFRAAGASGDWTRTFSVN
jgi:hypothetical protein